MANYTTADVKRLRELTAAGMMDCKRALEETDGDFDKAVEFLRVKASRASPSARAARPATAWSPRTSKRATGGAPCSS